MIPASIEEPARAAQASTSHEDAMRHQMEALAAAWRWGFDEFRRKRRRLWQSEAVELQNWIALAGEMPLCGWVSSASKGPEALGIAGFASLFSPAKA